MPGFPDKFVPFLDEPPGARMSTAAINVYGKTVRSLRQFTRASMNREPERPAGHQQPRPEESDPAIDRP
jgi:hydrogenase small subunit